MNAADRQFEDLWRSVGSLYTTSGMQDACLELQDSYGVNILMLLYLADCGSRGVRFAKADISALEASSTEIRDSILAPLRSWRRLLKVKRADLALYEDAKRAELAIERLELRLFAGQTLPTTRATSKTAIRANLEALASHYRLPNGAIDPIVTALCR